MKFQLRWLGRYLPGPLPEPRDLGKRLTAAGFILEGQEGEGDDALLDLEVTANRPDGMNHRGIAREAALALGRSFADPEAGLPVAEGDVDIDTLAVVRIEEPALCSRFSARAVEGIRMGPAGPEVASPLEAIGSHVISAPVDATNHGLWDIGQPMHAYDLDKLAKGEDGRALLVVRRARAGETLVTLDGVHRTLSPSHLVIADAEKPVGLAGVMGGLDTAISETTTRVLLEAANFDPVIVRKTARSLGMHTDASHRFERGADPETTREGLDRAARRIVADCGGTVARGTIHVVAREIPRRTVRLSHARLEGFLGLAVPIQRAHAILEALGFAPREIEPGLIEVTVPTWRVDIEAEVDLFEEVIRCVGYGSLPETLPPARIPHASDALCALEERVRDLACAAGAFEAQTFSFVSPEENAPFGGIAPGDSVRLSNPLGEVFSILRATPLIGLLASARHNVRGGRAAVALFEVGRAFGRSGREMRERRALAFLLAGASSRHHTAEPRLVDFFDGSGFLAAILGALGVPGVAFKPVSLPFLSSGRAAEVVSADGRRLGWVGVLSPALASAYDLVEPVVGELDLGALPSAPPVLTVAFPSRYPGSDFDLTVTHLLGVSFDTLRGAVSAEAPAELLAVDVRSRYQGPGVPSGSVKTSLNLRFGSPERSLSRDEVNAWREAAARKLLALPDTKVDGF
ncbi:MAG: phenylalanine--tRNA ligase subunit beta [Acidobacteria bacterium]|nr:phenylalanine--tRNA ligase subunit beta [Acidobacteriota bacterium]